MFVPPLWTFNFYFQTHNKQLWKYTKTCFRKLVNLIFLISIIFSKRTIFVIEEWFKLLRVKIEKRLRKTHRSISITKKANCPTLQKSLWYTNFETIVYLINLFTFTAMNLISEFSCLSRSSFQEKRRHCNP